MMAHFVETKRSLLDYLVLYRVGDFFETFFEDALALSSACDIALTSKDAGRNLGARVPMSGIPHYTVDDKCRTLLSKGINVAVVDQVQSAASARPGELVERAVTRLMTPGTMVDDDMMDTLRANYLCAVSFAAKSSTQIDFAVALADVCTGEIRATDGLDVLQLENLLRSAQPVEVLIPNSDKETLRVGHTLRQKSPLGNYLSRSTVESSMSSGGSDLGTRFATGMVAAKDAAIRAGVKTINLRPASDFRLTLCEPVLCSRFSIDNVESLGCRGRPNIVCALGALLNFVANTLEVDGRGRVPFSQPELFSPNDSLQLDDAALRNLEVIETLRDGSVGRSLRWAVDHTVTAMGARRVRSWLLAPLLDVNAILGRQRIVVCLVENPKLREQLRYVLRGTADLERLAGRVGGNRASPRELQRLSEALINVPDLVQLLAAFQPKKYTLSTGEDVTSRFESPFKDTLERLTCDNSLNVGKSSGDLPTEESLFEIAGLISKALVDPAPSSISLLDTRVDSGANAWNLSNSQVFREGFNAELDLLRNAESDPSIWVNSLEAEEQRRTGLSSIRIKRMRNMGYAFRIPRSLAERKLAENPNYFSDLGYERSLSTKMEMRFKSQTLQDRERAFYSVVASVRKLELELFEKLRDRIGKFTDQIRRIGSALATLDALAGFAHISSERAYVAPEMLSNSRLLSITESRHAVVEQTLAPATTYVPNSFELGSTGEDRDISEGRCDQMILCGPNAS
jgi:DNA mismatch repair protein MutS